MTTKKNLGYGTRNLLCAFAVLTTLAFAALSLTGCDDGSGSGGGGGGIPSELVGEWAAKSNPSDMVFKITSDGTFTSSGQSGGNFDKISVSGKTVEIKMSGAPVGSFDYSISNGEMAMTNATGLMVGIALVSPFVKIGGGSGGPGGGTHTHTYSATWSYNATQHWHECTAGDGAKTGTANHSGDPCTDCGYDSTATSVTFSSLTADGSASATTTTLALTFSPAIAITANDISLSGGRAKRTLERHGANLYPAD